jgi:Mn2+/Fe2+ NRAMP family transporter
MNRSLRLQQTLTGRVDQLRERAQEGMTTAEYAVGTLAACAFAAVLLAVVRSGTVKAALTGLIASALSIAS